MIHVLVLEYLLMAIYVGVDNILKKTAHISIIIYLYTYLIGQPCQVIDVNRGNNVAAIAKYRNFSFLSQP